MKILYCFSLFVLLLSSCAGEAHYTMDPVKIANVICDLHIAEAAAAQQEGSKKDSVIRVYYNQVYEIHGINEALFQQNIALLKTDLEEMEKVYKMVNDSLEKRKSRLTEIH